MFGAPNDPHDHGDQGTGKEDRPQGGPEKDGTTQAGTGEDRTGEDRRA
jgi:hypothetical protein